MPKKQNRNYWKAEEEIIIQQWADKAQCYQWMHNQCREIYKSKNTWYTIPVIIISTITGTANFAQDRFPEEYKQYIIMGIGTLSILAGIITTIHQFLKISELNEGHRVAAGSWGKFHNALKTLALRHPLDRMPPNQAIELYKDEYDRLFELSPEILKNILQKFNNNFRKNKTLFKPEICNNLDHTVAYEMTLEERDTMISKLNHTKPPNEKMVNTFFNLNGREPTEYEMLTMNTGDNSVTVLDNSDSDVTSESNNSQQSNESPAVNDLLDVTEI